MSLPHSPFPPCPLPQRVSHFPFCLSPSPHSCTSLTSRIRLASAHRPASCPAVCRLVSWPQRSPRATDRLCGPGGASPGLSPSKASDPGSPIPRPAVVVLAPYLGATTTPSQSASPPSCLEVRRRPSPSPSPLPSPPLTVVAGTLSASSSRWSASGVAPTCPPTRTYCGRASRPPV